MQSFNAETAARYILEAHKSRTEYINLPVEIAPKTTGEAYAAQEALSRFLAATEGPIAGLKIATTTKVMQDLMGIDHPCSGIIFEHRVHRSPARLQHASYVNFVVECELAIRVGRELGPAAHPYTAQTVQSHIAEVMPAFELLDDRKAHYKTTNALSLIADNCWNAGIVAGPASAFTPGTTLTGIEGTLEINGREVRKGRTDNPLDALAWVTNLAVERGRPLKAGMIVITGSVIPTIPVQPGDHFAFQLDGIGRTEFTA